MRRRGHSSSALVTPLRTRSRASLQALSGSPTIVNAGNASLQMRLDLDRPGLEPDDGVGERSREHTSTLRAKPA